MTKTLDNGVRIEEVNVDGSLMALITIGGGDTGNVDKFLMKRESYEMCSIILDSLLGRLDLDSPQLTIEEICGVFEALEIKYLNWVV